MDFNKKDYTFEEFIDIIRLLRSENGCPWDKVQTHQSVKNNLIEEAYEAVEALDKNEPVKFADELGDVLLQVVFHSSIAEDNGEFNINDVINLVSRKMIDRHTHIFGNDKADTPEEVLKNWDRNKQKEKGEKTLSQSLKSVCSYLPALIKAQKIISKLKKASVNSDLSISDKLDLTTLNKDNFGRLLLMLVTYAEFNGINAEDSLNSTVNDLIISFEKYEKSNKNPENMDLNTILTDFLI